MLMLSLMLDEQTGSGSLDYRSALRFSQLRSEFGLLREFAGAGAPGKGVVGMGSSASGIKTLEPRVLMVSRSRPLGL